MYIPTESIRQLIKCCEQSGVSEAQLFKHASEVCETREAVFHSDLMLKDIVSLSVFIQLIKSALCLSGNAQLGVQLGKQLNFMKHGEVGALAFASKNAADALLAFVNYSQQANASFMRVQQHINDDEISIVLSPSKQVKEVERFVVDAALMSCITMTGAMLSGFTTENINIHKVIRRFGVTYAEPESLADKQAYESLLRVPIMYGQQCNSIVFDRRVADQENPFYNPGLVRTISDTIKPIVDEDDLVLSEHVNNILKECNFRFPALAVVAGKLLMSERTLYRRLAEEGVSYRALCDALRMEKSKQWLASDMPVDEVAYRLGYFDSASFYKAFKRWLGMSPSGYRKSLGA